MSSWLFIGFCCWDEEVGVWTLEIGIRIIVKPSILLSFFFFRSIDGCKERYAIQYVSPHPTQHLI